MTETTVTIDRTAPAPAPPPAAPATPAAAPALKEAAPASTSNEPDSGAELESAFTQLESRYATTKAAPKETVKPADKAEPAKPPAKPGEKTEAKPSDKPKDDRQFQEGPKQLREKLEQTSKERDESMAKIKEYETRIKDFEARGKDTSALTDQLSAERKEKEALMGKIRRLTKETDPEFKEKWEKPFLQSVGYAQTLVPKLNILDENGQVVRKADWKDFVAVYQLHNTDPGSAIEKAEQLFGKAASLVLNQVNILEEKDRTFQNAKTAEEEKWKELETKEVAEQAALKERYEKSLTSARQALLAEKPELYDEDPSDPEGNELLKLGRQYMDEIPKTEEQMHRQYARNYMNAVAAPRLMHRLEKAQARIAELEAQINETKNSAPGTTKRPTQSSPAKTEKTWAEEMIEAGNT